MLDCPETRELSEKYAESYVEHGLGVYPQNAGGVPFTAAYLQSKGDPIVDLTENLAAEQKARKTYEYLISMCDDPDVIDPLRFLRQREIVHFQRFGDAMLPDLNGFYIYKPRYNN